MCSSAFAALTALVSSGLPLQDLLLKVFFQEKNEREKILSEISKSEKTTIVFESPHRLKQLINELKVYCGGEREIQILES